MQNVGIVGLGLIGGSLAKTIKLHTPYTVYGTDKNADTMRRAFLMEAIDGELTAETLPQCDVVLVCLYPQGIIDYVTAHAADFKPDSLVIDCGGCEAGDLRRTVSRITAVCVALHRRTPDGGARVQRLQVRPR